MRAPDEVREGLVRQWVAKADADLGVAQHLWAERSPYREAIGFHAQQAAEKYLKAYLTRRGVEFPRTHSLELLLDLITPDNPSLAASLRRVTLLTPYGVDYRYPGESPPMTPEDARSAVELAQHARTEVLLALGH